MIEVVLPPLEERELRLVPTGRRKSGTDGSASSEDSLEGRVKLGGPCAIPLTPEYAASSPDLRAFVEQEAAQSAYHLVHTCITFEQSADEQPLSTASVDLALLSPGASRRPIAWSMSPLRITDPVEVTSSVTLGPQLKLAGAGLAGLGATSTRVRHETEVFIQAFRELRADPGWRLQRTSATALLGSHRLVMVVRSEAGATTRLSLTINAAVLKHRILRPYSCSLESPLKIATVL